MNLVTSVEMISCNFINRDDDNSMFWMIRYRDAVSMDQKKIERKKRESKIKEERTRTRVEKHVRVCIEHGRDGENETKFKQDRKPNSSRGVPNNLDRVITQKRELRRVRGRAAAIFPRENFIARPRVHRVRTRHANYYV